jgi:endogenous inhibitor of DNA gyrase (YacG/DUF329 family)
MPVEKKCIWCGAKYKVKPYESEASKFCSRQCKLAYQRRNYKTVPCSYCGNPVTINWYRKNRKEVFCNHSCYYKSKAARSEVTCAGCGNTFTAYKSRQSYYTNLYCSKDCYLEYGSISTPGYISNEKYEKIRQRLCSHAQYLKWRMKVLERDGYKCIKCGNKEMLRVHHINELYHIVYKYNPSLSLDKLTIILESPEFNEVSNGSTLCNSCHIREHHK